MNLLSNGVKFTVDGVIQVTAWTMSPNEVYLQKVSQAKHCKTPVDDIPRAQRSLLYISVRDSGCGMSKEDQLKLFRDFTTLKSNSHLNPNGVGLGLSICRKICT